MTQSFGARVVRSVYGMLTTLAQPLVRRRVHRRAQQEPDYAMALPERFGNYEAPAPAVGWVWVHAVSLGETRAAAALVQALREAMPGMRLLLTHSTATGRAQGRSLLREGDQQTWYPWDAPAAVERFLNHWQPRIGLLMETEVWPVMAAVCARRELPLCLVNARLSEKSQRQALRLGMLARPAFASLHAVWAQAEPDAQRLRALGAPVKGVLGNVKFDLRPDSALLQRAGQWRQPLKLPVVLLASAREGEEVLWLQAWQALAASQRVSVHWLIVPRHPQRFDAVAALLEQAGIPSLRRSQWPASGPADVPSEPTGTVWLGDSLGEMPLYYGLASVALLGGSFAPLGGQNLIEAAACACPVIMGPHTFNFAEAAERAAQTGAALRVPDMAQALDSALALVSDPDAHARARQSALRWSQSHQGAAQRTAQAVVQVLGG